MGSRALGGLTSARYVRRSGALMKAVLGGGGGAGAGAVPTGAPGPNPHGPDPRIRTRGFGSWQERVSFRRPTRMFPSPGAASGAGGHEPASLAEFLSGAQNEF